MAACSSMTGTRKVWLSLVLLSLLAVESRAAEPQRVLMLHAFGHAYSPWSDMAASFRAEIIKRSPEPINLYEVSLDTTRAQDSSGDAPFIEYIRALLSGQPPDLIVPVGAPAAFFLQRNRAQLFPRTPMLILGADIRRIPDATRTEYDTGVLLDLDLPAYVANVLQLLPQTKNLAVVVGNSPVERYWASELRRAFGQFEDRVNIIWFNDLTLSEMQERAARMPAQSVIFWFLLSEDAAGVPYSEDRALEAMREVAAAPIFGMGDYQLGRGIVGGPLMQTKTLGQRGADVALRILRGDKPSALDPPSVLFGPPAYDSRELRRWGISEARLPHDSVVHFRQPTIWEQYRWPIMAVAAVIPLQSILISFVLFQGRRRREAEAEAALQRQEVAHLMRVSLLGELSGSIAHEINQPLTAILSNAQAALYLLAQKSPDLAEIHDALQEIVHEDNRAGEVIHRLRSLLKKGERKSEYVNINDLVRSTISLLNSELIGRDINVRLDLQNSEFLARGDSVQLQQVLLNLVMNAMDAMTSTPLAQRSILISTREEQAGMVDVRVKDRGHGIPPKVNGHVFEPFYTTKEHGLGLGLALCSTIILAHQGRLTLVNGEGGGAVAGFSLPVQKPAFGTA
jgi:signal transduction histidine kinase